MIEAAPYRGADLGQSKPFKGVVSSPSATQTRMVLTAPPAVLAVAALVVAVVLCGVSFTWLDASAARYAVTIPAGLKGAARIVTDLGLSGYMLVGSAAVGGFAYLIRRGETDQWLARGQTALMERAAFVFAAVAVSGLVAQVLKHVVGRARPKLIETLGAAHFDLFSIKASLASFPSGHTTSAFALAVALALIGPRLVWPLLAFAAAVGVSRFVVGAHYPSDVFGGAALGIIVALICASVFARRLLAFRMMEGGLALNDDGLVMPVVRILADRVRSRF